MSSTRQRTSLSRRRVLSGIGLLGASLAAGIHPRARGDDAASFSLPEGQAFVADHVKALAAGLSAAPFARPANVGRPPPFDKLSAGQYKDIRLREAAGFWRDEAAGYSVRPLPLGWIYEAPVEIWLVEGGKARIMKADSSLFEFGPSVGTPSSDAPYAFSGFRIAAPVSIADVLEDILTFQGASYFKAIGRGLEPGASARGLAINTAQPGGEEFPLFRAFWIEKPASAGQDLRIHALLDSESIAGAYRFALRPGAVTVMDVEATLYPRKTLTHAGLAPLTSMFFHGPADTRVVRDVRPAAHNSEGLAIVNGRAEHLWRPLRNPRLLQTSAFVDENVKGFGLAQRQRAFEAYEDLDAHFERRPTVWVEPQGSWGRGFVELIEIPTADEIHDNIVAYWKPEAPLDAGKPYTFAYRLSWGAAVPVAWAGAFAASTRVGDGRGEGRIRFAVDFTGPLVRDLDEVPSVDLTASAGAILDQAIAKNPGERGIRVEFDLDPKGTDTVELRLGLTREGRLVSETWLYRWTKA